MRGSEFYNADYFKPINEGGTGCYGKPFIWENEKKRAEGDAQALISRYSPVTALDVGCAKGFMVKALSLMGVDAYGCDVSQWAIDNCEEEVRGKLKQADIRNGLPYPDGSFDLVCSRQTLEHIEKKYLGFVASELFRVAKAWVHIEIPIILGYKNAPWGDVSHETYMPASYWISLFYRNKLFLEFSRCTYDYQPPCYEVDLAFYKKGFKGDGI